jgi:hypothetical protein
MLSGLLAVAMVGVFPNAPITLHYRVELRAVRSFDRSLTDTTGGEFAAIAFIATTLRDTTGGQIGHVVIDSVTCSGSGLLSMAYDPAVGRSSKDVWYDVLLIKGGAEVLPKPSLRNPLTDAIAQVTLELFPPVNRKLGSGESWVDTLDIRTATERWTESRPAITKWRVVSATGDEERLEGDLAVIVSVSGQVAGTGMIIGKRTMTVSATGAIRSAALSTTEQMLAAGQNAIEIRALRGTTTATVTLIPAETRP